MPDLESIAIPVKKKVLKLTIQNTQSVATANPHCQEIKLKHYQLLSILGANIDPYAVPFNTIFYDPQANSQAYSWYDGYDGTYHRWFVKTPSIGANSTYTLYMIIDLEEMLIDGNIAGINAIYGQNYLGLSYGQLDNGKNVFLIYDNFNGTTLSSIWSTFGSGTITVNNGITITATSSQSATGIFKSFTNVPSTGVVARVWAMVNSVGSSSGNGYQLIFGNSITTSGMGSFNGYQSAWWGLGNTADIIWKSVNGSSTQLTSVSDSAILNKLFYGYFMWYYTNQSYLYSYESNTNKTLSVSDTTFNLSAISQFAHQTVAPGKGTVSYTTYTIAIMDAPPSGVMHAIALSLID